MRADRVAGARRVRMDRRGGVGCTPRRAHLRRASRPAGHSARASGQRPGAHPLPVVTPAPVRVAPLLRWTIAGGLFLLALVGLGMAFPDFVSRHVVPRFLYLPGRVGAAAADPSAAGLPHGESLRIEADDGVELHAWWVPPAPAAGPGPDGGRRGCGAVVYFHGNAGTLVDRAFVADRFSRRGFGVLLVDYRGYGRSGGSPSEEGLYRDGRAAYRHVHRVLGHRPSRIALAGHSLGSAVAARIAAEASPGALVLTGAFRTMPELAREAYPWLPDPLFRGWTTNRFETVRAIARVDAPVLVARGGLDTLVPRAQTRGVWEEAGDPKRWYEAPAAGHDDLWDDEGFWDETTAFLADALGCAEG